MSDLIANPGSNTPPFDNGGLERSSLSSLAKFQSGSLGGHHLQQELHNRRMEFWLNGTFPNLGHLSSKSSVSSTAGYTSQEKSSSFNSGSHSSSADTSSQPSPHSNESTLEESSDITFSDSESLTSKDLDKLRKAALRRIDSSESLSTNESSSDSTVWSFRPISDQKTSNQLLGSSLNTHAEMPFTRGVSEEDFLTPEEEEQLPHLSEDDQSEFHEMESTLSSNDFENLKQAALAALSDDEEEVSSHLDPKEDFPVLVSKGASPEELESKPQSELEKMIREQCSQYKKLPAEHQEKLIQAFINHPYFQKEEYSLPEKEKSIKRLMGLAQNIGASKGFDIGVAKALVELQSF